MSSAVKIYTETDVNSKFLNIHLRKDYQFA